MGPLQLPISNVAVYAQSHFDHTGLATSIGEQPIKGLINPSAMARLALGESLTNLVWAAATSLPDGERGAQLVPLLLWPCTLCEVSLP